MPNPFDDLFSGVRRTVENTVRDVSNTVDHVVNQATPKVLGESRFFDTITTTIMEAAVESERHFASLSPGRRQAAGGELHTFVNTVLPGLQKNNTTMPSPHLLQSILNTLGLSRSPRSLDRMAAQFLADAGSLAPILPKWITMSEPQRKSFVEEALTKHYPKFHTGFGADLPQPAGQGTGVTKAAKARCLGIFVLKGVAIVAAFVVACIAGVSAAVVGVGIAILIIAFIAAIALTMASYLTYTACIGAP